MSRLIKLTLAASFFLCLGPAMLHGQCTVSAIGVSYGSYNPLDTYAATSTGTVVIGCSGTGYHVNVNIGPSPNSGVFIPRQMRQNSGSVLLNYNIYTESNLLSVWGDGTGGSSTKYFNVKKNNPYNAIVYGMIPPGQDVATGGYAEALTVTINF